MKIIIGLGNPGKEYENTRHNIGFKAIDLYAHHLNIKLNKHRFQGKFYKDKNFILAKPQTYMNLSGLFVKKITKYYKIEPTNILIIYDDMDLPAGTIRYREKGSAGGQKGMIDIIDKLGTQAIKRLKIGIGRHHNNAKNYVLGNFTALQLSQIDAQKTNIIKIIEEFIKE